MRLIDMGKAVDTRSHLEGWPPAVPGCVGSPEHGHTIVVERFTDGLSVVNVIGDIDSPIDLRLHNCVTAELYSQECLRLLIDLSRVGFCGASGLSSLVQAHDAALHLGVDLEIVAPRSAALRSVYRLRDLRATLAVLPNTTFART